MKPAGLHLLSFVLVASLAAQETVSPVKTSARLTQEIRFALPPYAPPVRVLDRPQPLATEDDPGVLALPKLTVKEKRPPSHDPDVWLTQRAIQQRAMAAYQQSMTDFEWALNSWFIPIFSPPAASRARGAYEHGKLVSKVEYFQSAIARAALNDPGEATRLGLAEQEMEQARSWQLRPAGEGRKK